MLLMKSGTRKMVGSSAEKKSKCLPLLMRRRSKQRKRSASTLEQLTLNTIATEGSVQFSNVTPPLALRAQLCRRTQVTYDEGVQRFLIRVVRGFNVGMLYRWLQDGGMEPNIAGGVANGLVLEMNQGRHAASALVGLPNYLGLMNSHLYHDNGGPQVQEVTNPTRGIEDTAQMQVPQDPPDRSGGLAAGGTVYVQRQWRR